MAKPRSVSISQYLGEVPVAAKILPPNLQIGQQSPILPKVRDNDVGPGLDETLPFPGIDPPAFGLVAGHAHGQTAHCGRVLDLHIAVAEAHQPARLGKPHGADRIAAKLFAPSSISLSSAQISTPIMTAAWAANALESSTSAELKVRRSPLL